MSSCASCGRQRSDDDRFCAGCGMEFADSAPAAGDKKTAAADASDTRVEPPAAPGGTFASWYQSPPPGNSNDAGSTYQPTQTVGATPTQAAGSGFTMGNPFGAAGPGTPPVPPTPFPPMLPPTGPPVGGPPGRGGRRWLFMTIAVIVVLAAGGGAYALATAFGKHTAGQPSAGGSTQGASSSAPASPAGGGQATSAPAPASASPTPSPELSLVAVAAGVSASATQPQVENLLSHYFEGINTHSYAEYSATLNAAEQAKQTQAQFTSGYSSTTDSAMTLTSLTDSGSGGLTATVSFTSHQSPAQSIDKSACNTWTLNLYLVQQGGGYLIGPAPSGYQPTYADC
jgi:hypothetical protein